MTTTPFLAPKALDHLLRTLTPKDAAAMIAQRLKQLRIRLVTTHGYLKSEDSAVCAIGSLITLMAGHAQDLLGVDLNLDNGLLLSDIENDLDKMFHGADNYYMGGVEIYRSPYYTWLMDNTEMTFGEVKSLENGFEGVGYDPNPAGLTNEEDNGEVYHFYRIGVLLRRDYSISSYELDDEEDSEW